ncbi:MAG TPA: hypothetical protein VGF67_30165 [Ktedonobacteraceae bacterium]|jgi:hypothetical protein
MIDILIDPVIAMAPSEEASKEEVEVWLKSLDLWLTEALSSPFTWLYAKETIDDLLYDNRFPSPEILFRWQRKYRLNSNISSINAKISKFFNREEHDSHLNSRLEKMGYVVITMPGSVVITPGQFAARWTDAVNNHMCELLATACVCKHNGELFAEKMRIATLMVENTAREIEVSAIITESLPNLELSDNQINQTFPLIFTPVDLEPLFNIVDCWDKGQIGVNYAIKRQYKRDWYSISPDPLPYEMHSRFISSVVERKNMTDILLHKIIRTMGSVIADKPDLLQYKPHWLREREESHTPQLLRPTDGATAWRITVTHDGAGWRMHYWRKVDLEGNVKIEFSNILTKKEAVFIY